MGVHPFFQIWVTKTYQVSDTASRSKQKIHKIFKQIQNNKKNKIPQISHTQIAYMRSDGFFFFRCCSGNNDPTDLCHTICAIKIRSCLVFIPISEGKKFSRSVLHSLCPHDPWDSLLSLFRSNFFLLIYFKWDPKEKKIFRSFGVQICTTPIRRFF